MTDSVESTVRCLRKMTDRATRYAAFDTFRKGAKELFKDYADSTQGNKLLNDLYSLRICPGGRNGGLNKKEVEVFYGNRLFDSVTEIGENFQKKDRFETAHGATLSYQRTDDGQVLCTLHPAASENYRPPEDFIFLGIVKNPLELKRKSKQHWKMFLAYMESTCLDGKPNLYQKLQVFYLRNFKETVVKQTLQKRKISVFFGEVLKYTATVGLSGFIILFVTWAKDSASSNQDAKRHQELLIIYSRVEAHASSIAKSLSALDIRIKELDKNTVENLQALNAVISENATRIEKAVSELELVGKTESGKLQNEDK